MIEIVQGDVEGKTLDVCRWAYTDAYLNSGRVKQWFWRMFGFPYTLVKIGKINVNAVKE